MRACAHTCIQYRHAYTHMQMHACMYLHEAPPTTTVQRGNDMSELNDAGTYFDLGLKKVTQLGTYYYMCTRNNNFSNRDQKSKIIIQEGDKAAPKLGGTLTLSK